MANDPEPTTEPVGEPYIDVATGEPGRFDPDGDTLPCCLYYTDPDTGQAYSKDGSLRLPDRDVAPAEREREA